MEFEKYAACRLIAERMQLTERWSARIAAQTPADECGGIAGLHRAAHVPEVLAAVAEFVIDEDMALEAEPAVREAVATLASLRRQRGCSAAQVVREFELLAQELVDACGDWLQRVRDRAAPDSVLRVVGRLNRATLVLGAMAVEAYACEDDAEQGRSTDRVRAFADTVAHELKTPLNAASVTAQLLEYAGDVRSSEAKRLAALIRRNIDRADVVLNSVRAAALPMLEPSEPRPLPFGQVLASVLTELRDEIDGAQVELDIVEPIPGHAVDAARVRIVLANLVRNAIRYRDTARAARVQLRFWRRDDGTWCVEVRDNGVGIPAEHHRDVFHHSFRAHADRTDGTGVGLLIVKREVEELGGTIEFSSEPGTGTSFRFSLPDARA